MTTLPTTTDMRLARPMGMPAPAAAAQQGGLNAGDIWRILRANAVLILCAVVIAAIVGVIANFVLLRFAARYTATGLVQVDRATFFDPFSRNTQSIGDFETLLIELRSQAALLSSPGLIDQVLGDVNGQIRQTGWFSQFVGAGENGVAIPDIQAAKGNLEKYYNVSPIVDSKLISVSMSCDDPADAQAIVTEMVNRFLEQRRQLSINQTQERVQMFTNMRARIREQLTRSQQRQRDLVGRLSTDGLNVGGRIGSLEVELQQLVQQQTLLQANAAEARAQYESIASQIQQGIDPPIVDDIANSNQLVMIHKSALDQIDIELAQALYSGSQSRVIQQLEARRQATRQKYDEVLSEARIRARDSILSQTQSGASSSQQALEALTQRIAQMKSQLSELNVAMAEYVNVTNDIDDTRAQLQNVEQQLATASSLNLLELSGVTWAQLPVQPEEPSFPRLGMTVSIAVLLGLALSLGIAFLRELLDTTVRSPRDIARIGQMNLLGMVPHEDDDPQTAGIPLHSVLFRSPTSNTAEQYRQVRTRLQQAVALDNLRALLVTSPSPGDGKTTVACNVAAALALNGRRVLLVDANFRRPELHKVFALDNARGFGSALADPSRLGEVVQRSPVSGLDVLPLGPRPDSPTELLEGPGLGEFIQAASETYDHVIFDSGPLLIVSEAVAMAPRVDGVITVVRASVNSRGLLQRLRDAIRQLSAEHVGVVLNGVRAQGGGYYARNIKTYYQYQNGQNG